LGLLTCKNRLPYNLYCVGGDVKHCTTNPKLTSLGKSGSVRDFSGNLNLLRE